MSKFDLATATILGGSPTDVASWPITTLINKLTIGSDGVNPQFDGRSKWLEVISPGAPDTQFTLWIGMVVNDESYTAGILQYWKGLSASGGDITINRQIPSNWTYFCPPLNFQPAPGELVSFFVTQGNQRRGNHTAVRQRSNVVTIAMPHPSEYKTYNFDTVPDPQPEPEPNPVPNPVPNPIPDTNSVLLTQILAAINDQTTRFEVAVASLRTTIDDLKKTGVKVRF